MMNKLFLIAVFSLSLLGCNQSDEKSHTKEESQSKVENISQEKMQSSDELGIELLDYGIVSSGKVEKQQYLENQELNVNIVNEMKVAQTTTDVPLEKNTSFGISARISGVEDGKPFKLSVVVDHPEMTLPSGEKKTRSYANLTITPISNSYENVFSFTFNDDYELVPGKWEISLMQNDQTRVSKAFSVK